MTLTAADVDRLAFEKQAGLLPAIVQHADTGAVLMLGYMNRLALEATIERGRVVFFSRSKQRLWEKGETSLHTLDVIDVVQDCDDDTLLVLAIPRGPTCHTGTNTCFGDVARTRAERFAFLGSLEGIVEQRVAERPEGSYTARLFASGTRRIAQKVGEEGVEVALAATTESPEKLVGEAADFLYHLVVLLKDRGVSLEAVTRELESRHLNGR